MATTRPTERASSRVPWADVITGLGILAAIVVLVLGAILAVADDNGYGGREYVRDVVLTAFALAALLYARAHVRDRIYAVDPTPYTTEASRP